MYEQDYWCFYGFNEANSIMPEPPNFMYIKLEIFNENYLLDKIIELNWDPFSKYSRV